ncbi:DnaJ domain-containing protein [Dactylosporangium roseum]|uniref:DnaJ domain-containing protein n=1 Tax=Dactylosporangium roseum TaxID=47989 RepID=A0ABY5Z9E1_9ACTN|nr:DnaJ C-terminal domain-containing protein [Dactylosporangium roseum]UWZ38679.1 DnaJ domain-containing protein [Dactylosporangium roseum]
MPVEIRDYYAVLGVRRDANAEEIQRAYRTLARRHHPDVNREPGAEERFKEISEAYHVLSNPRSRRKYDRFGAGWRQAPDDAGSRGTGRRQAPPPRSTVDIDLEDLLGSLFGGRFGGGFRGYQSGGLGSTPVPGADTQAELTISVEDAYLGGRRRITMPGPAGRPRQYGVDIPAGVVEGQRIRLAGQGAAGARGGRPGDLYLVVHLAPHPRYKVEGRDVMVDLPVSPWEAALGAVVPVGTPGGDVRLEVPTGSSSGRRLRLRGQGVPNPRGTPGDLFAEVRIVVPGSLSRRERQLFEELAAESTFDPREAGRGAP